MTRPSRIAVLGATGSIGANTLDVIARHPDRYEAYALTAHSRVDELAKACAQFRPALAVVSTSEQAAELRTRLSTSSPRTEVLHGAQALSQVAAASEVDAVMAAIVGAAGLPSCMAAARAGKRLMLANKEALVVGGALFMQAVREGGASLLPVDSEHSAIFQCLPLDRSVWPEHIDHIVLTASGGPFRTRDPATLCEVTPAQAVAHPNWVMGRKISVDSATMMNKALEVIEARWLFGLEPEQIRVMIHPQSIIHSMVCLKDNSVLAQLGTPDMRVPIAYAMSWPHRAESGAPALDLLSMGTLTFEALDPQRFPGLDLAYAAMRGPDGTTAVLNAANEVAVAAFLDGAIGYTDIHRVNEATLDALAGRFAAPQSLDDLLALDEKARRTATAAAQRCTATA